MLKAGILAKFGSFLFSWIITSPATWEKLKKNQKNQKTKTKTKTQVHTHIQITIMAKLSQLENYFFPNGLKYVFFVVKF
jgi:hypothetical protein